MAEQRRDSDSRERISEVVELAERNARLLVRAVFIGGIVIAVALGGAAFAIKQNADRNNDIQQSRFDNTLRACEEQNGRHDKTVHQLDLLLQQVRKLRPAQAQRAAESRAGTVLLIDALAPKRPSCRAYTEDRVGKP